MKLTRSPRAMAPEDAQALRRAGSGDGETLDIALITAYVNFVNRIASGLGVEVSEDERGGYRD